MVFDRSHLNLILTDRVSLEGKAIGSVRLFVCLSVCLFPLYLLNRLTFELCVWAMTLARIRLKATGQGQDLVIG